MTLFGSRSSTTGTANSSCSSSTQPETIVPATDYSSSTSSSSSSANSSPTVTPNSPTPYQRPSTLHGLKHKLHSVTKNLHSPNRRKSVGHIPLSPLARTPSPSPLPQSPTRSPSPLTFSTGHQPGSSNTTQSYSPSSLLSTPNGGPGNGSGCVESIGASSCCGKKATSSGSFGRSCKTSEPGSPLLRRALSPDRLHPRTAETKSNSISPLCDPALKVTTHHAPRVTVTTKSPPMCIRSMATSSESPLIKTITTTTKCAVVTPVAPAASMTAKTTLLSISNEDNDLQMINNKPFVTDGSLPRIAEEKDHQQQSIHGTNILPTTVVTDKPKSSSKSHGGNKYFFNRKFKHNKDLQQPQSIASRSCETKNSNILPPPSPPAPPAPPL